MSECTPSTLTHPDGEMTAGDYLLGIELFLRDLSRSGVLLREDPRLHRQLTANVVWYARALRQVLDQDFSTDLWTGR